MAGSVFSKKVGSRSGSTDVSRSGSGGASGERSAQCLQSGAGPSLAKGPSFDHRVGTEGAAMRILLARCDGDLLAFLQTRRELHADDDEQHLVRATPNRVRGGSCFSGASSQELWVTHHASGASSVCERTNTGGTAIQKSSW